MLLREGLVTNNGVKLMCEMDGVDDDIEDRRGIGSSVMQSLGIYR